MKNTVFNGFLFYFPVGFRIQASEQSDPNFLRTQACELSRAFKRLITRELSKKEDGRRFQRDFIFTSVHLNRANMISLGG